MVPDDAGEVTDDPHGSIRLFVVPNFSGIMTALLPACQHQHEQFIS
jgi:hypothetical protein